MQKVEELQLPKLRKVSITPKEEPVKKEVKKTKVKIPKAKKYEELPEIPDYERPQLEIYEESEFSQNKAGEKQLIIPTQQTQQATQHKQEADEPLVAKNGLGKVQIRTFLSYISKILKKKSKMQVCYYNLSENEKCIV